MLPYIPNIPAQSSIAINRFRGINKTESYEMGELCSSENTSSERYPAISSRKIRTKLGECEGTINGIGSYDGIFYTYTNADNSKIFLCYNGTSYEFTSYSESDDFTAKRYFSYAGGNILIIPDKVTFNVADLKINRIIVSQTVSITSANAKFKNECTGNSYSADYTSTFGTAQNNSISSKNVQISQANYTRYDFYPSGFSIDIEAGDMIFVKMEFYSASYEGQTAYNECQKRWQEGAWLKVKSVTKSTRTKPKGGTITEIVGLQFDSNSIDLSGYSSLEYQNITIERRMPDLERIISYNNRIWAINEDKVYTSRLGDADEWYDFSIDNYGTLPSSCFSAAAGTPGNFTAIFQHGNYVYAFKENYIHKIYGDTPDEYSFSNLQASGCIKDADTISVCGNYLMYASDDGICILRDGYPRIVSKGLGALSPVCAASHNGRYYIICNKDGGRVIYVYDLEHDIWTMESCAANADNIHSDARSICYSEGGDIIYLSDDAGEDAEEDLQWSFRMRFDRNAFDRNTSVRAVARIDLGEGADFEVKAVYDDGTEGNVCRADCDSFPHGRVTLRLPIKRDLGFCLDFSGSGSFVMRSIKFNYYKSFEE